MMQQIAYELHQHTHAFSIKTNQPAVLDFCMAPGGFVSYIVKRYRKCSVDAFSLPPSQGGHDVLIKSGEDDPRVQIHFADITMYAAQFGIETIAQDHLEQQTLLQPWPHEPKQYDLVLCDGQVLRTQIIPEYRKGCEASRLTNAQLFLGLEMIKEGGTMIILPHKAYISPCFKLICMFNSFSEVQLYKSSKFHKERSWFYLIAKNVRARSPEAITAMEKFKRLWEKNTFQPQDPFKNDSEDPDTDDLRASVHEFGPRFIELARPIWQTQVTALKMALWMQKP